jgi:hypothetical protein
MVAAMSWPVLWIAASAKCVQTLPGAAACRASSCRRAAVFRPVCAYVAAAKARSCGEGDDSAAEARIAAS